MSDQASSDMELKTALTDLETNFSIPIVSGELDSWITEVQKAWKEASATIHYTTKHLHPRQYEQMIKEDQALLPRIDLLKSEDDVIEQQREQLGQSVARAAQHIPRLEPDEAKALKQVQSFVDEGLKFVVRVRKHEIAVQTWFGEAFNRDRGAVD